MPNRKKTKIVATWGQATSTREVLKGSGGGVDDFQDNFFPCRL